jgi:hypothetical protein
VSNGVNETYLFLYGEDMEPPAVRSTYPGARFVARAWVAATVAALPPLPQVEPPPALPGAARSPDDAVWGILLQLPALGDEADGSAPPVQATTDDERRFAATIGTSPDALADRAAVVNAARYWELPPFYVRRLAAWAESVG